MSKKKSKKPAPKSRKSRRGLIAAFIAGAILL